MRRVRLQFLNNRSAILVNNSNCILFPSGDEMPQERPASTVGIERVHEIFGVLKEEGISEKKKKMKDFSQVVINITLLQGLSKGCTPSPFDLDCVPLIQHEHRELYRYFKFDSICSVLEILCRNLQRAEHAAAARRRCVRALQRHGARSGRLRHRDDLSPARSPQLLPRPAPDSQ